MHRAWGTGRTLTARASRFIRHLEEAGFTKEKEVTFPHKQAWFGRLRRESWEGPAF
jgi:hypothetical protein